MAEILMSSLHKGGVAEFKSWIDYLSRRLADEQRQQLSLEIGGIARTLRITSKELILQARALQIEPHKVSKSSNRLYWWTMAITLVATGTLVVNIVMLCKS